MLPRMFLTETAEIGRVVEVTGEAAHHHARVLRVSAGEQLVAVADGTPFLATVESVEAKGAVLRLKIESRMRSHESSHKTYLIQAMAKGDKVDEIVQMTTEVGVAGVIVLEAARSVARLQAAKVSARVERWRKIAAEAAGQSQRDIFPEIEYCANWEALGRWWGKRTGLWLMLDEAEQALGLKQALASANGDTTVVLVGPEGGWEDSERTKARDIFGAVPVTLGPRILRTETAGLAAVSVVLYDVGELGG